MLTCAQWAVVAPLMETDHSIVASFGALVQEDCLGCGTGLQTGSSSWLLLRVGQGSLDILHGSVCFTWGCWLQNCNATWTFWALGL